MNKKTFCPYPFSTLFLGADSGVKPCCSAIKEIGFLNKDNIETILQGDIARSIRKSILNEEWHPICKQCKEIEDMGGRSERSTSLEYGYEKWEKIQLDETYFVPEKIDLRWTNTCNLACNYCYEYFSSQWSNIKGIKVNTLDQNNEESLFFFIEKHKDTIESVNLLGGEPFLQKQNQRLIEMLPNRRYYILTNLAVPLETNKIAQQLLAEPFASCGVSFETVGKRFEYVRHNAKWSQFTRNIEYIKEVNDKIKLNAHPLYCTYSAFNLVEYYDYLMSEPIFHNVFWCVIRNIDGLNVFKLPEELRRKAIAEIELCEKKFPGTMGIDHLLDIRQGLIESLNDTPVVHETFDEFTNEIETTLKNKEHSFEDLWPEISSMLKDKK